MASLTILSREMPTWYTPSATPVMTSTGEATWTAPLSLSR